MVKEIQKERIKQYFIDAAKDIIKEEGVDAVSVRKVADLAGYSYGTIYNYFSDLNHLLWYAGLGFIQEMMSIYENKNINNVENPEDFRRIYIKYLEYYMENPNIFQLFFCHQLGNLPEDLKDQITNGDLMNTVISGLNQLAMKGLIDKVDIPNICSIVINSLHGILLMYFSNKNQITKEEVYSNLNGIIDYIFKIKGE